MLERLPVYDRNRVSKLTDFLHFVLKRSFENLSIAAHWVGGERFLATMLVF
jgi:hypothetical protein